MAWLDPLSTNAARRGSSRALVVSITNLALRIHRRAISTWARAKTAVPSDDTFHSSLVQPPLSARYRCALAPQRLPEVDVHLERVLATAHHGTLGEPAFPVDREGRRDRRTALRIGAALE
jgi:hypothetical protein